MDLSNVNRAGNKKRRKRIGRGHGSGSGKTSGRGQKGQRARTTVPRGFQGGQTPLYMRLPTLRGISNKAHNIGMFRKRYATVNVGQLARFEEGAVVTPEVLMEVGMVRKLRDGLKVLGEGDVDRALTVRAHAFSGAAREKIEQAGGVAEVID